MCAVFVQKCLAQLFSSYVLALAKGFQQKKALLYKKMHLSNVDEIDRRSQLAIPSIQTKPSNLRKERKKRKKEKNNLIRFLYGMEKNQPFLSFHSKSQEEGF
jgi:hypothetical protein